MFPKCPRSACQSARSNRKLVSRIKTSTYFFCFHSAFLYPQSLRRYYWFEVRCWLCMDREHIASTSLAWFTLDLAQMSTITRGCHIWALWENLSLGIHIIQLLTYVEVDMECYWTVNVTTRSGGRYDKVYCSITLHVYRNISQQLFYYQINVCFAFPVILYH